MNFVRFAKCTCGSGMGSPILSPHFRLGSEPLPYSLLLADSYNLFSPGGQTSDLSSVPFITVSVEL